jgi:hypothetical protein
LDPKEIDNLMDIAAKYFTYEEILQDYLKRIYPSLDSFLEDYKGTYLAYLEPAYLDHLVYLASEELDAVDFIKGSGKFLAGSFLMPSYKTVFQYVEEVRNMCKENPEKESVSTISLSADDMDRISSVIHQLEESSNKTAQSSAIFFSSIFKL